MAVWGYVRVSANEQNTENQKLSVLEYANKNRLTIDYWIAVKAASRKSAKTRKLDEFKQLKRAIL